MKTARVLLWLLFTCACGLILAFSVNTAIYDIAGLKTRVSAVPSLPGSTIVAIPPLGEIIAKTHQLPITIKAEVVEVDHKIMEEELGKSPTGSEYFNLLEKDAKASANNFALRLILFGAVGGLLGSLLVTRKWYASVSAAVIPVLVLGLLVIAVSSQYDPTAFTQPRITGPLGSVPLLATSIKTQTNPIDTLIEDVTIVAGNLKRLAGKIEAWQPASPEVGTVRMLVVSDIHNNPAAFSLINQIAEDFKVDVIVDAGDMTDYGTNLETGLVTKLVNVGIPYIFVTGNHDSPAVTEALTATPSVTILSGTSHTERGITFFGYPHPSGARMDVDPGSDKDMKNVAADVERAVEELDEPPDVLLVHDWRMAEAVTGKVPLIITGHTHKARIGESLGTVVINPGSTGDSGLRQLKRNGSYDTRYTLGIVYFDTEARRVAAFDAIEVSGLTGEFSLTRTLTGQSD